MSFSRSSGKRHYGDKYQGSNYYKREGFLSRILRMFGSFSNSDKGYNNYHSHNSDQSHHRRRKSKSSWS